MNLSRIYAVILRHIYEMKHNWFRLTDMIFWPLMDLLLWAFMTVAISESENVSAMGATFLGAIIIWWLYFRIEQDVAFSFLSEIWDRNFLNLFTTPLKMKEYFTGTMLLGLAKIVITASFLVLFSYIFFNYTSFFESWAMLLLVINLIFTGWVMGIFAVCFLIRYGTRAEYMTWFLPYLIQPFSAVMVPLEKLPHWLQVISLCLPTTYVFEGLRSIILNNQVNYQGIAMATLLNLFYFGISSLTFAYVFNKVKEKGGLAKLS